VAPAVGTGACWPWSPKLGGILNPKGAIMIWETPKAVDLRLGMEITMYADHR
jgi:coenzyme PQQ precursor peptide PqqA